MLWYSPMDSLIRKKDDQSIKIEILWHLEMAARVFRSRVFNAIFILKFGK